MMASTYSTKKGRLNYYEAQRTPWGTYAYIEYLASGNLADKTGTVKNGKYVSTRIFNNTYKLQTTKYHEYEKILLHIIKLGALGSNLCSRSASSCSRPPTRWTWWG